MKVVTTVAITAAALLAGAPTTSASAAADTQPCERGEFCLWPAEQYEGDIHRVDLDNANTGECLPLPENLDARSFANRTARPVTVYQGRDCSTEGEFATYPGGGTFVPEAPYLVRGVQIWDH